MISKNIPALSDILDDSFALVHMTAFLKAVEDGTLNYASAEHDSIDVTVNGDTAALMGKSRVHAAVFGGGWHTWRLRLDLQLMEKAGRWKIILAEASTY